MHDVATYAAAGWLVFLALTGGAAARSVVNQPFRPRYDASFWILVCAAAASGALGLALLVTA